MIGRNDCFRPGWAVRVTWSRRANALVMTCVPKRGRMDAAQFHPRRAFTTENSKGGFWSSAVLGRLGLRGSRAARSCAKCLPRDLAHDFVTHRLHLLGRHPGKVPLPCGRFRVIGLAPPNIPALEIAKCDFRVDIRIARHHAEHDAGACGFQPRLSAGVGELESLIGSYVLQDVHDLGAPACLVPAQRWPGLQWLSHFDEGACQPGAVVCVRRSCVQYRRLQCPNRTGARFTAQPMSVDATDRNRCRQGVASVRAPLQMRWS